MYYITWPPVRGVCTHHEGVMLHPKTVTPPYLVSVINCYVSYYSCYLAPPFSVICPFPSWEGGEAPSTAPDLSPILSVMPPHRIISPPGRHLSTSQNPETHRSLHLLPTPLLPCLLRPHHAFGIYNAAFLPLPKYLFMYNSTTSICSLSVYLKVCKKSTEETLGVIMIS